jgi:elongation factor G
VVDTGDIRNVVLLGHGSSGKTSLAEAMLHITGATNRLGSVDEKTSTCDYYDEEKEHQHSIQSSTVYVKHAGKLINIIDTPGYPDFTGSAIKAIPAAETAILVISAAAGIETNTRKMFQLATEAGMPRVIVVNKMDESARGGQSFRDRLHRERDRRFSVDGRGPSPYGADRKRDRS